ncbi:MAG: TFIIB-type zinc ribbon-containing protein [Bacilli bacterium]|nr:TFIIB-type zinc ribbon-containing protein [Bacilli bacterium]
MNKDVEIIETGDGVSSLKNQCPNCGARELKFNEEKGKIFCLYCDSTFDPKEIDGIEKELSNLNKKRVGSGARDIDTNFNDIMTFRCPSCSAEVVVDTKTSTQARCHWCHGILTINERIDNGAVPDAILPFKVKKEEAMTEINNFVSKRQFYALPQFKKDFTADNTFGVYFPYLLVDVNAHCKFSGEAEELIRSYTLNKKRRYDAKAYNIEREFDITIDDLTIESSSDRLNKKNSNKTNNIINSIMPFDTENCVKFESNYLVGYTSEKRDINISNLKDKSNAEIKDVVRASLKDSIKMYNRGVSWKKEEVNVLGSQWIAAYLPVWLYSYRQKEGNNEVLHYIAVNARTKETMGSVPINKSKLFFVSALIEILSVIVYFLLFGTKEFVFWIFLLFLLPGFLYHSSIYKKYRNQDKRHRYEKETKNNITNLVSNDSFIEVRKKLYSSVIYGRNDDLVSGDSVKLNQDESKN